MIEDDVPNDPPGGGPSCPSWGTSLPGGLPAGPPAREINSGRHWDKHRKFLKSINQSIKVYMVINLTKYENTYQTSELRQFESCRSAAAAPPRFSWHPVPSWRPSR